MFWRDDQNGYTAFGKWSMDKVRLLLLRRRIRKEGKALRKRLDIITQEFYQRVYWESLLEVLIDPSSTDTVELQKRLIAAYRDWIQAVLHAQQSQRVLYDHFVTPYYRVEQSEEIDSV